MGPINVEEATKTMEMDSRMSLDLWYRIADNIYRQAAVYRSEHNYTDLYILLVRYISLVAETIPQHDDYRSNKYERQRASAQKKMGAAFEECYAIKPKVMKLIEEHNNQLRARPVDSAQSLNGSAPMSNQSDDPFAGSLGFSSGFSYSNDLAPAPVSVSSGPMDLLTGEVPVAQYSLPPPSLSDQFSGLSANMYQASEETLSRHSFFGTPLHSSRNTTAPVVSRVQYYSPSSIDSSPVDIPLMSIDEWLRAPAPVLPSSTAAVQEVWPASTTSDNDIGTVSQPQRPQLPEAHIPTDLYRQPEPPPVAAQVDTISTGTLGNGGLAPFAQMRPENVADPRPGTGTAYSDDILAVSKGPKKLHISTRLMKEFLRLASGNTKRNLETCGILAGNLRKGVFYVTTLIIPKQESTSDTCNTVDEETIFHVQDQRQLFQLGWIHTHPSQSCFMSSVDLHTHYSYQVMLPEAIAIVMAPTDSSRKHGIFRLSDPGGLDVLRNCSQKGFHPHETPSNGGSLYETSGHVFMNGGLPFDIVDLR